MYNVIDNVLTTPGMFGPLGIGTLGGLLRQAETVNRISHDRDIARPLRLRKNLNERTNAREALKAKETY